jgi:uncharacterized protein YqeY
MAWNQETDMLRESINDAMKSAMKSQEKLKLSTLRLVNAAIKNADIEARTGGKGPLSDDDVLGLLQKMIKQRQESVELYDKGGRKELADQERGEIEIIKGFLPQQMSEAEAKAAIAAVIKETGALGMRDMGKVMAALKERHAGKMDFGKASGLVKSLLAG